MKSIVDQLYITELRLKVLQIAANVEDRLEDENPIYTDNDILNDLKTLLKELN